MLSGLWQRCNAKFVYAQSTAEQETGIKESQYPLIPKRCAFHYNDKVSNRKSRDECSVFLRQGSEFVQSVGCNIHGCSSHSDTRNVDRCEQLIRYSHNNLP